MNDLITKSLLTILGGVISGVVGVCLFFYKRKRDAKDAFLVFLSMQRRSLDYRDFLGWYHKTRPEFRNAISAVHPFLSSAHQTSMDAAWREYDTIQDGRLNQENEKDYVQEIEGLEQAPRTPKPSEILHGYFDRFQKLAK